MKFDYLAEVCLPVTEMVSLGAEGSAEQPDPSSGPGAMPEDCAICFEPLASLGPKLKDTIVSYRILLRIFQPIRNGRTSEGSFSAVSAPIFASKY